MISKPAVKFHAAVRPSRQQTTRVRPSICLNHTLSVAGARSRWWTADGRKAKSSAQWACTALDSNPSVLFPLQALHGILQLLLCSQRHLTLSSRSHKHEGDQASAASSTYSGAFFDSAWWKNNHGAARSGCRHFSRNEIVSTLCKRAVIIMLTELFASLCASPHKHSRRHYPSPGSPLTLRENNPAAEPNSLLCLHT